jgi:hypothetical protein
VLSSLDVHEFSYCLACVEGEEKFCSLISKPPVKSVHYTPRQLCESSGHCQKIVVVDHASQDAAVDFRISKSLGSKGYNKIRISVISNETMPSDYFSYSNPFKFRWKQFYLNTGEIDVTTGKNSFEIAGEIIDVYIPQENEAVRGVLIADPCFTSEWIVCMYQNKFEIFNHTIELLNAINSHDDTHFRMILGDNFYDQQGYATSSWFQSLSKV